MEHTVEGHKQIFFEEMGSLLKTKREELDLSIDDIVEELKFSKDIVYGMENAVIESLPNPVYAKGFYRAYATLLHIDQSIVTAFINTVFVEKEQEPPAQFLHIQMNQDKEENTFDAIVDKTYKRAQYKKITIAIMMVLLVLIIPVYFIFFGGEKTIEPQAPPSVDMQMTSLPVAEANVESSDNSKLQDSQPVNKESVAPLISPQKNEVVQIVKEESSKVEKSPQQTKKPKSQSSSKDSSSEVTVKKEATPQQLEEPSSKIVDSVTTDLQEKNMKKSSLRIVATGEVWVEVKYDGKRKDFTLQQGQTRTIEFTGTASVKIGDLSAAEIYFGDKAMKNLGAKGKVKTYTFSADE